MSKFIKPSVLKSWKTKGKKRIITSFKKEKNHQDLLVELVECFVKGELEEEEVVEVIPTPYPNPLLMLSVFWALDFRYPKSSKEKVTDEDAEEEENEEIVPREKFLRLVTVFLENELLDKQLVKESFFLKTVEELNLINLKIYKKTYGRIRTTELYMQRRYNLMSEESEGYSKLLNEFLVFPIFSLDDERAKEEKEKWIEEKLVTVRRIVGTFLLDPNRVLDLLLDVFESHVGEYEDIIITFITKLYNHEKHRNSLLMKWMIVKFRWYSQNDKLESTSSSLYRMAACLITQELIETRDLFPYLMPHNKIYHQQIQEHVQTVSEQDVRSDEIPYPYSQKVHLWSQICRLKRGREKAIDFLRVMSVELTFPCYDIRVHNYLLNILEDVLQPYYNRISLKAKMKMNKSKSKQEDRRIVYSDEDHRIFQTQIFPLVMQLSSLLGKDVVILTRLIRVFQSYFTSSIVVTTGPGKRVRKIFWQARPLQAVPILARLMAGLAGLDSLNPQLSNEVWGILEKLSYQARFETYSHVAAQTKVDPYLHLEFQKSLNICRGILQKVVKDNAREKGRALCKCFVKNPLAVVNKVVAHLGYGVFVDIVIEMTRLYSTKLVRDVLVYRILSRISDFGAISGEADLKKFSDVDGYSPSEVLRNYGTFIGKMCATFSDMRLSPIFNFVTREGSLGSWQDLFLLRRIIESVSLEEIYDDIKPEQVESLCGGHILRVENAFDKDYLRIRRMEKMIDRLAQWLCYNKSKIAHNLLRVISKLRKHSELLRHDGVGGSSAESQKKMMRRELYCVDKCQETLMIFIQFLRFHTVFVWSEMTVNANQKIESNRGIARKKYQFQLPGFDVLISWGMESEMLYTLCHPMIYSEIAYPIEPKKKKKKKKKQKMKDEDEDEEDEGEGDDDDEEEEKEEEEEKLSLENLGSHQNPILRYFNKFLSSKNTIMSILPDTFKNTSQLKTPTAYIVYTVFWCLDVHDIHVPKDVYRRTGEKLVQDKSKALQDSKKANTARHYDIVMEGLKKEEVVQNEHEKRVREAIQALQASQVWDVLSGPIDLDWFIRYFIYPRVNLSTADAIFCAYFVENVLMSIPPIKNPQSQSQQQQKQKRKKKKELYYFSYELYLRKLCLILPSWFRFSTEFESMRIARFMTYTFRFIRYKVKRYKSIFRDIDWISGLNYDLHGEFSARFIRCFVNVQQVAIRKAMLRVLDEMKNEYPEFHVHGDMILQNLKKYEQDILRDNKDVEALYYSYVGFLEKRLREKALIQNPPTPVRPKPKILRKKIIDSVSSKRPSKPVSSSGGAVMKSSLKITIRDNLNTSSSSSSTTTTTSSGGTRRTVLSRRVIRRPSSSKKKDEVKKKKKEEEEDDDVQIVPPPPTKSKKESLEKMKNDDVQKKVEPKKKPTQTKEREKSLEVPPPPRTPPEEREQDEVDKPIGKVVKRKRSDREDLQKKEDEEKKTEDVMVDEESSSQIDQDKEVQEKEEEEENENEKKVDEKLSSESPPAKKRRRIQRPSRTKKEDQKKE